MSDQSITEHLDEVSNEPIIKTIHQPLVSEPPKKTQEEKDAEAAILRYTPEKAVNGNLTRKEMASLIDFNDRVRAQTGANFFDFRAIANMGMVKAREALSGKINALT